VVNITGENISTFCVLVLGPLRRNNNNLSILADLKLCAALETAFLALFG
jgi:hypothetical protein